MKQATGSHFWRVMKTLFHQILRASETQPHQFFISPFTVLTLQETKRMKSFTSVWKTRGTFPHRSWDPSKIEDKFLSKSVPSLGAGRSFIVLECPELAIMLRTQVPAPHIMVVSYSLKPPSYLQGCPWWMLIPTQVRLIILKASLIPTRKNLIFFKSNILK